MTDNIYKLVTREDGSTPVTVEAVDENSEPQPATIKVLEKLLAMAKTGRLQTFLGVGFTDDGQRMSVVNTMHENVYEMMGSLAWMQFEYARKVEENRS